MSDSPYLPDEGEATEGAEKAPLLFKVTIALTALYLIYRLGQGVVWLVDRVF